MTRAMRVLWTHNFDPDKPNSQVFMNIAAAGVRARGVDLQLEYLGNLRTPGNFLAARRRVRDLAESFDLVHAQYGSACGLATAAVEGRPKALSIRGNDWSVHSDSVGFYYWHTRLARGMTRLALGRYDCLLSVSNRMARELRRASPGARVETFPSPIDLARFVPRDRAEARAELGFPGNTETWILFNALKLDDPIKRYPLAQAAVELASARRAGLRLRVASDLPHAVLPLFAAACDLILCTSETEGWPNSVKEALACNVPFVATDISDLREIAEQEPSCRVCEADAVSLADGICEALEVTGPRDLRRHVVGMGLDVGSDRLVGIYASLLATRSRGG
jgi:glycosyltransferase involved in cell wall biosynthesis